MAVKEVMVVGGSITGIQVGIDLANRGYKVHMVERSPSIGGRMAQLDKTFPTNDCAICILAPKMIECYQHPNINCLTYSEVVGISGKAGDFKVRVLRRPRYVNEDLCTGCGECVEKCPTKLPNEFDMDRGERKAIYVPFPQAVPKKMTIDPDHCRFFKTGKCRVCEKTCQRKAIDFEMKEETMELSVGAVVVCTGLDFYDLKRMPEYGYGRIDNVVTAMELERFLNASGPTMGHLKRPSDGKEPKKVAFIQCAGSRDEKHMPYCTGVCCMHSIKEAILVNEHDADAESVIFYIDLRTAGKGFQEYLWRAQKDYKVSFVRSKPGRVTVNGDKDPIVWYEDTRSRTMRSERFDLVVLAQALVASMGTKQLAKVLALEEDGYGFLKIPDPLMRPVDTSVEGIFACGYCQAPMDIPQSVAQASGAAARVSELLEEVAR